MKKKIWLISFFIYFVNFNAFGETCSCSSIRENDRSYPKLECKNEGGDISILGYISDVQEDWLKSHFKNSHDLGHFQLDCKNIEALNIAKRSMDIEHSPARYPAPASFFEIDSNIGSGAAKEKAAEKESSLCRGGLEKDSNLAQTWGLDEFAMKFEKNLVLNRCEDKASDKFSGPLYGQPVCYAELPIKIEDSGYELPCYLTARRSSADFKKITIKPSEWESIAPDLSQKYYEGTRGLLYMMRGNAIEFVKISERQKKESSSIFLYCPIDGYSGGFTLDGKKSYLCDLIPNLLKKKFGVRINHISSGQVKPRDTEIIPEKKQPAKGAGVR